MFWGSVHILQCFYSVCTCVSQSPVYLLLKMQKDISPTISSLKEWAFLWFCLMEALEWVQSAVKALKAVLQRSKERLFFFLLTYV